ncbi:MAG: GNAT family N-acetyltransferase, partial [Tepidisphaeraceae bacterium]
MSTPVQLRDGIMSDAPALAGLMTQLGYETTTVQMRERLGAILPHQYFATFVAEVGDRVVGMVGAELAPGYEYDGMQCRILALVVDEGFHRNGIGRLLLVQAEAWAESQGAWKMTVNTAH